MATTAVAARSQRRSELVETLNTAVRSPAAWFFAGCWLVAALILVFKGVFSLQDTLFQLLFLVFIVLTVAITEPVPAETAELSTARPRHWLQVAALLVVIVLTGYTAFAFHRLIPSDAANIPLWTPLMQAVSDFGTRILPPTLFTSPGNSLVNPAKYLIIPLILLLLLGARLPELGFRRGHRTWVVILLWCGIEVAVWAARIITGSLQPLMLVQSLISNTVQNGPFEEFLFRGALQTRLARVLNPAWGLVLASLIFGLWHLGMDVRSVNGDWLGGAALAIKNQALLGLVFGIIFMRTRNLVACSVFHVVFNTFNSV